MQLIAPGRNHQTEAWLRAVLTESALPTDGSFASGLRKSCASKTPDRIGNRTMAKYLISFPSAAMVVPDGEIGEVSRAAHAVIDQAKAAGVYVFGGGIDESVPPVLVSADGSVAEGGYPWAPRLDGGFCVLELPSREEAVMWAARIAKACRCGQELRVFQYDPQA
jgi:hypothetical protein